MLAEVVQRPAPLRPRGRQSLAPLLVNITRLCVVLLLMGLLAPANLQAQTLTFDSGSTGADGALILTTPGTVVFDPKAFNPVLDPEGDNIYHFTSITIGAGVTVTLSARQINAPAFWLASGPVQIDGTINLNGEEGQTTYNLTLCCRKLAMGGAGGYPGGLGAHDRWPGTPGYGPGRGIYQGFQSCTTPEVDSGGGGGGAHSVVSCERRTDYGQAYGNAFLLPLIGGSGGGGGLRGGGGGGGGAFLLASSTSITINGAVMANGGRGAGGITNQSGTVNGNRDGGGGGAGGAIRLIAPTISGAGKISALGGGGTGTWFGGRDGRIRLEAFQDTFSGSINPKPAWAPPVAIRLPAQNQPASVRIIKVNNVAIPANLTGNYPPADVTINIATQNVVEVEARNVPPGNRVSLTLYAENAPTLTGYTSTPLVGTLQLSTAVITVTVPPGYAHMAVSTRWTP